MQERVRLQMKADAAEFALEREKKLRLPAAEVERGLSAVAQYLRRCMMAIPVRLSVDRRVMAEVDREIHLALTEVSQGHDYGGVSLPRLGGEGDGHGK